MSKLDTNCDRYLGKLSSLVSKPLDSIENKYDVMGTTEIIRTQLINQIDDLRVIDDRTDALRSREMFSYGIPRRHSEEIDMCHQGNHEGDEPLESPLFSKYPSKYILPRGKLDINIISTRNLTGLSLNSMPFIVCTFENAELTATCKQEIRDHDEKIPEKTKGYKWGVVNKFWKRPENPRSETSSSSYESLSSGNTPENSNQIIWKNQFSFDVLKKRSELEISFYESSNSERLLGKLCIEPDIYSSNNCSEKRWYTMKNILGQNTSPESQICLEWSYKSNGQKTYGPDNFEILRMLGKGTFGQVYQVEKKDTKALYAMKVISKRRIIKKREVGHTINERNILVKNAITSFPFIVSLKFSFQTLNDLYLITDFMSGGELFLHLQRQGRFPEHRAQFYCAQLVLALEFLHDNDIIYRDLKPENVLLDAKGNVALCDFGLSKLNLKGRTRTFCGTTEYIAPELLLDETGYTKMVDFWSLGVLMFEMCCGWSPFYASTNQQMYHKIAFGKIKFPANILSKECRLLIKGLMNRNPSHRIGALGDGKEIRSHAFFRNLDWDNLMRKEITPPFRPHLNSDKDTSYFDPIFTQTPTINFTNNMTMEQSTISPRLQEHFVGFTFNEESFRNNNHKDIIHTSTNSTSESMQIGDETDNCPDTIEYNHITT